MVFHWTFMLALFYDKKCCNFINLFTCILWDLIVMGLVLSWWRLLKIFNLRKAMWGAHVEVQESVHLASISILGQPARYPARYPARWPNNWEFKYDSSTLHPYYIYLYYPHNCKEAIQKKNLKRGFYNTLLVRESYSSS